MNKWEDSGEFVRQGGWLMNEKARKRDKSDLKE